MDKSLTFLLKLKDMLSPAIKSAAGTSDVATSQIVNDMHKVNSGANLAATGVKTLRSGIGLLMEVAAPFVGVFAGFEFLKGTVEAADSLAQANGQLEASLKSTKGAAGLSAEALRAQAEALEKTTTYGHDATIQLQSLLLTFTSIKGGIFTQAVPVIQDLSTKLGVELKDSAIQVGKALNDPIQGITALRRVGVSFTDSQTDVIKKLVKTGHLATAQTLILAELKKEFGGSAAAAAAAGAGPFKQLAIRMETVKEEIGGIILRIGIGLMPLLNGLVDVIHGTVEAMKSFYHWCQNNKEIIGLIVIVAGSAIAIWAGYTAAITIASLATEGWTLASKLLNAALWSNPVTWVIAGIIALVAIIGYLVYAFDGWGKTWKNLMDFCKYSWSAFKDSFVLIWLNVQDQFMSGLELIEKGWYHLKSLWDADGAAAGLVKINTQQNKRAEDIAGAKGLLMSDVKAAEGSLKWEVKSNGKSLSTVVGDLKKKLGFSGITNPSKALGAMPGVGTNAGAVAGDIGDGADKSKGINQGGQRSIVINIGKQIEKLEQHIIGGGREAADEIEGAVKEAMRRVVYSLNNVAS